MGTNFSSTAQGVTDVAAASGREPTDAAGNSSTAGNSGARDARQPKLVTGAVLRSYQVE